MRTKKIIWWLFLILFMLFLAACSTTPTATPTAVFIPTASRTVAVPSATRTVRPTKDYWSTPTPTSDYPTPAYPSKVPGIFINPIAKLGRGKEFVYKIMWAPDGETYAIYDNLSGLNIFDTKTNKKIRTLPKVISPFVYYSPDSRFIAVTDGYAISLIGVSSGAVIASFSTAGSFITATFSSDNNLFAYVVEDCPDVCKDIIHVWNIANQKETIFINAEKPYDEFSFTKILFDPSSTLLLAMTNQDAIYAYSLKTGALKFKFSGSVKAFGDFLFSKNGKYLASYADDKEGFNALVWKWDTRENYRSITEKWDDLDPFASEVRKVDFSNDDSQLEVMIDTHSTLRYQISNGEKSQGGKWTDPSERLLYQLQLADDTYNTDIDTLAYSPDGLTLAAGSKTGPLRLWDLQTQKIRVMLDTTAKRIQYNHKGDRLVVLSETDNLYDEISIWDTTQNTKIRTLLKTYWVEDFMVSPDDSTLAMFVSDDQEERVELWDIERGVRTQTLYTSHDWHQTNFLSYTQDGHVLYLAQASYMKAKETKDGEETPNGHEINVSIHSWDVVTGAAFPEIAIPFPFRFSAGFLLLWVPQHDKLVISWDDILTSDIALWDMKTGQIMRTLSNNPERKVPYLSLPTGEAIVADFGLARSFLERNFGIYDLKTGRQLYYFSNERDDRLVVFNADGSQMAVRDNRGTIVISDVSIVTK